MLSTSFVEDLDYTFRKLSLTEREKFKNATVMITGCAGFLGYYFMRFFERHAKTMGIRKIIGLDNFMLGTPKWIEELKGNALFSIIKFDIVRDNVASVPQAEAVDYIIHMASIASPVFYRKYPIETLDANVWGLRSLLDFYKKRKIKGFLFYSSSEIYGDPSFDNIPTREDYRGLVSATGPRACYDEAKRFGETMCMLFSEKYDMPIGVARPFNNYGPGMKINDKRVPADFAKAVMTGKNINILSNGTPTRTFCYIADAAVGYLKILVYGKYDYFNIGIDKPEITIRQLADIYMNAGRRIFQYTGHVSYQKPDDAAYLTNNPQRRCPNIEKAKQKLNFAPEVQVGEGVARFLKFLYDSSESEYLW